MTRNLMSFFEFSRSLTAEEVEKIKCNLTEALSELPVTYISVEPCNFSLPKYIGKAKEKSILFPQNQMSKGMIEDAEIIPKGFWDNFWIHGLQTGSKK